MSGKGSDRRPTQVSEKEAEENWNLIFGKGGALEGSTLQHNALYKKLHYEHFNHLLHDSVEDQFADEDQPKQE